MHDPEKSDSGRVAAKAPVSTMDGGLALVTSSPSVPPRPSAPRPQPKRSSNALLYRHLATTSVTARAAYGRSFTEPAPRLARAAPSDGRPHERPPRPHPRS
jgi:hypothetical protein